jgi:hypothetical protein
MGGTNDGFFGQKELATGNSEFNQLEFVVRMLTGKFNIATLAQVVAVNPAPNNTSQAVGTVDVLPLVGQVDGGGAIWPATTIFDLPYFRLQAGTAAILVDPVVGDVGLVVFCDKDISSVKASQGQPAGPASARRFDMADGFYVGGWMSAVVPTNYIQVNASQIEVAVGGITAVLTSSGIVLTGPTKIVGTLEVTGNATFDAQAEVKGLLLADASMQLSGTMSGAGGGGQLNVNVPIVSTKEISSGGHTLTAHTHAGVQSGGSNTAPPSN